MIRLVRVPNLDVWQPQSPMGRWVVQALKSVAVWETRRQIGKTSKEDVFVLGPETLKHPLGPSCAFYTSYVEEFAKNPWESLLTEARQILAIVNQTLDPLWQSEEERRAWRAAESWFVHKVTYRHLGPREMMQRLRQKSSGGNGVQTRVPLNGLVEFADGFFERREREKIWRQLLSACASQTPPAASSSADVLLLSAGIYAPRVIVPLARKLLQKNISCRIIASASSRPWPFDPGLSTEGLPWNYFLAGQTSGDLVRLKKRVSQRAGVIVQKILYIPLPPSLSTDLQKAIRRELRMVLELDWVMAGCLDAAFNGFLDRCRPQLIVQTKNLRVMEGIVSENALTRQIPVLYLDTAILAMDVDHIRFPAMNHVVVSGPKAVASFQRLGAPDDHIHRFGDLRFDRLLEARTSAPKGFPDRPGQVPVLAVGETIGEATAEEELKAYYQALVRLQSAYPQLDILLKLHPKQTLESYERQAEVWGLRNLRWIREANTYDLISQSACVVTHMSQVGVESLFMGKPLFIYLAASSPRSSLRWNGSTCL